MLYLGTLYIRIFRPGDRESSVPTSWDRTLSQLVGTELSLSPGRIWAHNPNLPGYREIHRRYIAGDCYHHGGQLSGKNSIALDSSTNVQLHTELV